MSGEKYQEFQIDPLSPDLQSMSVSREFEYVQEQYCEAEIVIDLDLLAARQHDRDVASYYRST